MGPTEMYVYEDHAFYKCCTIDVVTIFFFILLSLLTGTLFVSINRDKLNEETFETSSEESCFHTLTMDTKLKAE